MDLSYFYPFYLTKAFDVTFKIYNILGQGVRTLINEERICGFFLKWK